MESSRIIAVMPWWPHDPTTEETLGMASVVKHNKLPLVCALPSGCEPPPMIKFDCLEYFSPHFFKNQWQYSRLLLSSRFYDRFGTFARLVVIQSDVLLLRELSVAALDMFDYSYTGAPWIQYDRGGNPRFHGAGNGGFSIRDVPIFSAILKRRISRHPSAKGFATNRRRTIFLAGYRALSLLGVRVETLASGLVSLGLHEDTFWARVAPLMFDDFTVCPPVVACNFAVEREPAFAMRSAQPPGPIGAHGWKKHGGYYFDDRLTSTQGETVLQHGLLGMSRCEAVSLNAARLECST
jgi:hypothetical protein